MDKQFLLYLLGVSVALVLGGRWAADAIFPWLDQLWGSDRRRADPDLDDLIQSRLREWNKSPTRAMVDQRAESGAPVPALDAPPETPEQLAEKQTLQRIYAFDTKRRAEESDATYARRLLGLTEGHSPQDLRQAFRDGAKKHHPDTFRLDVFPPPLRKRLAARVHSNFLAIQRAHDILRRR